MHSFSNMIVSSGHSGWAWHAPPIAQEEYGGETKADPISGKHKILLMASFGSRAPQWLC